MKWFLLLPPLFLFFVRYALVLIGRGVMFAHAEYEDWDETFHETYRSCCLATDLKTATPFAVVGLRFLALAIWRPRHERHLKNQSHRNL